MLRAFSGVLMVWVVLAAMGRGQMKPQSELMRASSPALARPSVILHALPIGVQRLRMQNIARQDKLVSDTNKLLALISNFNQQVNRSDVELSPAEIAKKAEEIEKLARRVKDGMRE
jgi:hypothetical protein